MNTVTKVQINHKKFKPEVIYFDEFSHFCANFTNCPRSLRLICKSQCERVGHIDCNMLNEFIKDIRGIKYESN